MSDVAEPRLNFDFPRRDKVAIAENELIYPRPSLAFCSCSVFFETSDNFFIYFLQKRKFDAIYYHMRILMFSNPINSAKESMQVLFDEIRKKVIHNSLAKEKVAKIKCWNWYSSWIHPDGGRRIHRTALLEPICTPDCDDNNDNNEELLNMDSIEVSNLHCPST